MDIGLIVYSQTGNTYSVATNLQEKLSTAGHSVTLERIEVVGEVSPGQAVQFKTLPDASKYDALVFGSPVQAFSLCQAMVAYLKQVPSLQGKKVACLVTQAFPYPWLGGNRAIRQMKRACDSKGATVCGSGIVNWMKKRREQQIVEVVDQLSGLF
jgi:NAD(P)H dehydrogenase (quinone)